MVRHFSLIFKRFDDMSRGVFVWRLRSGVYAERDDLIESN